MAIIGSCNLDWMFMCLNRNQCEGGCRIGTSGSAAGFGSRMTRAGTGAVGGTRSNGVPVAE
jgi:hypothetical protein